jgi:hypothetical protein
MEYEAFGILHNEHFFHDMVANLLCLHGSLKQCLMCFWMVKYGLFSLISSQTHILTHRLIITNRFGRENFQEAMKLVYRMENDAIDWNKFRFEVFDVPTHPGVYQDRYNFLGW